VSVAIHATAVSTDPATGGSIAHAAAAADECLRRAGVHPEQIDLLINTGVYRDENMAEPAMAALVQKRLGMNLDYVTDPAPHPAFSFDLMNGACGVLNAVQVAGAFLAAGETEYALVVSSDAHPSGRIDVAGFPYATLGAAMLLRRTVDDTTGFGRVHTAEVTAGPDGVTGYIDLGGVGADGRERIEVRRDADHTRRLVALAAAEARRAAAVEGAGLSRTLFVASQPTPTFAVEVADRLGIPADAVVTVDGAARDPHSSALTLAYHQAVESGQAAQYPQVLFLAAGAGPTAACAFYRPEPA
jgi:3-oxoacyl-[acyl-carrier-protein] synthase III